MSKQNASDQIRIRPEARKRINKIIERDPSVATPADVVDKALDAMDPRVSERARKVLGLK